VSKLEQSFDLLKELEDNLSFLLRLSRSLSKDFAKPFIDKYSSVEKYNRLYAVPKEIFC
jgi:hypothetical protein